MARYAEQADLIALGINADAIAGIDPTKVNEALDAASAKVDSYLRAQFTLPLTQFGKDIVEATSIIAAYSILSGRGYNPAAGSDPNLRQRYVDIVGEPPHRLGWLDLVAKGAVTPDATGSSSGSTEGTPDYAPMPVSSSQRGWSNRGTGRNPNGPFQGD